MPGKFVDEIRIYKCGTHADGTAIFCTELTWAKIPFLVAHDESGSDSDDPSVLDQVFEPGDGVTVGWQETGYTDVHIPLTKLVTALEQFGTTVSYDEEDLARRLGPPPDSE